MATFTITTADVSEEEAAAALAAVTLLLAEEAAGTSETLAAEQPWRGSARLMAQGLTPTRLPAAPRWSTIERLRRAGRGNSGIVGS